MTRHLTCATDYSVDHVKLLKLDVGAFKLLLGPLQDIMKTRVSSYDLKEEVPRALSTDIKMEELKALGVLGKGSFGTVVLVEHKGSGTCYALKSVFKQQIVETHSQGHIINEKKCLMELNHPFIIRLHATYKSADKLFFLLEPGMGGELFRILRKRGTFNEATSRFYAASVILAFEYMHSKDIIYRDLKPEVCTPPSLFYLPSPQRF
jgi:hypothetical protein